MKAFKKDQKVFIKPSRKVIKEGTYVRFDVQSQAHIVRVRGNEVSVSDGSIASTRGELEERR